MAVTTVGQGARRAGLRTLSESDIVSVRNFLEWAYGQRPIGGKRGYIRKRGFIGHKEWNETPQQALNFMTPGQVFSFLPFAQLLETKGPDAVTDGTQRGSFFYDTFCEGKPSPGTPVICPRGSQNVGKLLCVAAGCGNGNSLEEQSKYGAAGRELPEPYASREKNYIAQRVANPFRYQSRGEAGYNWAEQCGPIGNPKSNAPAWCYCDWPGWSILDDPHVPPSPGYPFGGPTITGRMTPEGFKEELKIVCFARGGSGGSQPPSQTPPSASAAPRLPQSSTFYQPQPQGPTGAQQFQTIAQGIGTILNPLSQAFTQAAQARVAIGQQQLQPQYQQNYYPQPSSAKSNTPILVGGLLAAGVIVVGFLLLR